MIRVCAGEGRLEQCAYLAVTCFCMFWGETRSSSSYPLLLEISIPNKQGAFAPAMIGPSLPIILVYTD
jgi:hypothetical protein